MKSLKIISLVLGVFLFQPAFANSQPGVCRSVVENLRQRGLSKELKVGWKFNRMYTSSGQARELPLIEAIRDGELESVLKLTNLGASVYVFSPFGSSTVDIINEVVKLERTRRGRYSTVNVGNGVVKFLTKAGQYQPFNIKYPIPLALQLFSNGSAGGQSM